MKKRLFIAALIAMVCVPFASAYGQESEEKSRISIDINVEDDEQSEFDEQIESLVDLLGKFDTDAAEEVAVEIEGLSEDEKRELVKKFAKAKVFKVDNDDIPAGAIAIMVPAIVMVFGTPLFILIAVLVFSHRRRRQKMEMINAFVASGQPVPEQVLSSFDGASSGGLLRSGISLSSIGLGLIVAFTVLGNEVVAAIGFIPFFIGLGRLLYWRLENRKQNQSEAID